MLTATMAQNNGKQRYGMAESFDTTGTEMHVSGDTLVMTGDLDLYEAPRFREFAEAFVRATENPRFDMTAVPFLDSAGLACLLSLSRLATTQHKTLRIAISGGPRRVLKITGIDRVLVVDDEAPAS